MLGVIFDFNGTMFFDEDFQEISWKNYIRQKTGHDISHEEFQHCIHGRNSADSLEYFLGHPVSRDLMDAFEEEKEAIYRNLCLKSKDFKLADGLTDFLDLSHNHHFKWWFGLALIRAGYMLAQKGGYRKRCYWSAYKAVLLESSFLDSSACSLIYFFIASSVILPIVET